MPIEVVCPKCQSRLRAPDEVAGKNVRCKKCQEKFKVPNPGPAVDSVGDTQQLSVLEMPLPKIVPAVAKPVAAEPMLLDDSAFDEPLPAVVVAAKPTVPRVEKTDEDRPRKKKRSREDDEEDEDNRPRRKKEKSKPVIGGEPTFAMPGAAEDPVVVHVPPPAHASQFSFEPPPSNRVDDDDDDDRPRKKKRKRDEVDDDDSPKKGSPKKPAKGNNKLLILGAVAAISFLGCGGAAAAIYFFVIKVADDVSKSTGTVGSTPATKEDGKNPNARFTNPTNPSPVKGGVKPMPNLQAGGPAVTPFVLPEAGESKGPVVAPGTLTALPFAPDFVKQVQLFDHAAAGVRMIAVTRSDPVAVGKQTEDTVYRFNPALKEAGEFQVPADGFEGRRILDLSDNGERVAIEAPKGCLTVYDFSKKTKLFDGFDLRVGVESITGIAFGDATGNRLAVVDNRGAVDVWDLDERQRVVKGTRDPGKINVFASPRKSGSIKGVIANKGWIKSVNWNTGSVGPAIKLPAKSGPPTLVATQEKLGHTAIVHTPEDNPARELLIVDKAGAAVLRMPLPAAVGEPRTLTWFKYDQEVALGFEPVHGMVLLDFAEKVPYVYLKPGQEKTVLSETGELYLVPDPKMPGKAAVVTTVFDVKPQLTMLESAKTKKVTERLFAKPEGLSQ